MNGGYWLWVALAGLGLAGVFGALHVSLRTFPRGSLEDVAAKLNRAGGTKRVAAILQDPDGHAIAVALPRMLSALLCAAGTVAWIGTLRGVEVPGLLELLLGLVAASLLLWVFGMVVPASVARHLAARTVYAWSPLIRATHTMMSPLLRVSSFFDEVVRRLAGEPPKHGPEALEAELLSVVEEGEREGKFDETDRDMIEAVVEFRSTTVEQIMTPRTEVEALEYTDDLAAVKAFISDVGHSRIPVYEENLDHVLGILYAKDLLRWMAQDSDANGEPFSLRPLLRHATFVPETKTVRELLVELLANRVHIAMVADEYGGTSGLVTIEDIVEEIFGEIEDEYEKQDDERPSIDIDPEARAAEVDARKYIDDANDQLKSIGLELPEHEDYDTVGGFVVVTLGHIPTVGETLRHEGATITVLEAEQTRVLRIRVESAQPEEDGQGESSEATPAATAEREA